MQNDKFVQSEIDKAAENHFTNRDAEMSAVGCFLNDFLYCKSEFEALRDDDITVPTLRTIVKSIKLARDEKLDIDIVTVSDQFPKLMTDDKEISYATEIMLECIRMVPSVVVVGSYLQILQQLSARRRAIAVTTEMQKQLLDPSQDVNAIMDKLRVETGNMVIGKHTWVSMQDVIAETYTYLERRANGEIKSITSGIKNVDAVIGGFFGGELTVIGARPAVGKSVFGMNVAMAAARSGFKVGVCSREMTAVQYGQRILSYVTSVDGAKIRKAEIDDEDWIKLAEGLGEAAVQPIDFLFTVQTIEDLRAEVQRKAARGEIDMLIVDYLQLMSAAQKFEADRLRVGYISKALKDISVDFNIPVIALAQVKRYAGGARAKMPTLEDLKDSGSIEQDADGVLFLHNPYDSDDEYVDPRDVDDFETYKQAGYTYLCIGIAKQRQGPTGKACVLFDKRTMHYYTINREES